jgi:hypothetical protein
MSAAIVSCSKIIMDEIGHTFWRNSAIDVG